MKRKTYLELPGNYKTLKSNFLKKFEESEKEALVLNECVNLLVGKTYFTISLIIEKTSPNKIISKKFTLEKLRYLLCEFSERCVPEDIESLRFVPHIVEFIEDDGKEILSTSYSEYYFYKQYPITDTTYSVTGFRVTRS